MTTCPECGCVCLSGDQDIDGHKHFKWLVFADARYDDARPVGLWAVHGVASPLIMAPVPGEAVVLEGWRHQSDPAGNVVVRSKAWRVDANGNSAGYAFAVNCPRPIDSMVVGVAENGDIHFGQGRKPNGDLDVGAGSFVDIGPGGHVALRRSAGNYTAIEGALGAVSTAVQPNGDAPPPGPYTFSTPNGERYKYAGGHGDVNLGSEHAMRAGFLAELSNPLSGTGARTDHRCYWDMNGAYSQNHQLTRAQFPSPRQEKVLTNHGEFFYEAAPGSLYWAVDTQHWYHANPVKNEWMQFAEQSDLDAANARIAALEATVAALVQRVEALEAA